MRASIFVVDDELFGGDEQEHEPVFGDVIVGDDDVPLEMLNSRIGVGGEVRADKRWVTCPPAGETRTSANSDGAARPFR